MQLGGDVHLAGTLTVAIGVQHGVRHGLRNDDADGVAVDGDPRERIQHRAARTRHALGLGREIDVEQVGLVNLSHCYWVCPNPRRLHVGAGS